MMREVGCSRWTSTWTGRRMVLQTLILTTVCKRPGGVCLEEPSHIPACYMPASIMPASIVPTGVQEIVENLVEEPSSTFMMCHASASTRGTTYAAQTDGEWQEPEKDVQVQ